MKKTKKQTLAFDLDGNTVEANYREIDPTSYPLWYQQLFSFDDKKRKQIIVSLLKSIEEAKPEAFEFIKKNECKLVGLMPRVEYALMSSKEGDTGCTWIHAFSQYTFVFWCENGGFGLFINPVIEYNDSVLNKIPGNTKQSIKGFTG